MSKVRSSLSGKLPSSIKSSPIVAWASWFRPYMKNSVFQYPLECPPGKHSQLIWKSQCLKAVHRYLSSAAGTTDSVLFIDQGHRSSYADPGLHSQAPTLITQCQRTLRLLFHNVVPFSTLASSGALHFRWSKGKGLCGQNSGRGAQGTAHCQRLPAHDRWKTQASILSLFCTETLLLLFDVQRLLMKQA